MLATITHRDAPNPVLPWPVLIAVPPAGLGAQLSVMRAWLDHRCGPAGWAAQPVERRGAVGLVAFRFADRAAARAFVERFSCGYRTVCGLGV